MKKKEFEEVIEKLKLKKKHYYKPGIKALDYYVDKEKFMIYGCFNNKDKKYIIFFKDFERDMYKEIGEFETEDEAYDNLLDLIKQK